MLFTFFAYDRSEHLKVLVVTTFYMLTSIFLADMLIKSRLRLDNYSFQMLFIWTFANLVLLFLFFIFDFKPGKGDFSGVFHDRNVFAITTLLVIGFSISFRKSKFSIFEQYIFSANLFICFGMVIASKSITGLLGMLVICFLYSFKLTLTKRLWIFLFVFISLLCLLVTDNPISERLVRFGIALFGDTDSLRNSESAYLRVFLIKTGIEIAKDNILFGVGLNNASQLFNWPGREFGSFLHNNYLDILTSGGIPLFIVYYTPLLYAWSWLIKNRKKVKNLLSKRNYDLWEFSFISLSLKFVYDLTWTSYFEFFLVVTVTFSVYSVFYLKSQLRSALIEHRQATHF
ncbi:O-antigen ligase family protein [Vibrio breoganii]|uniref:O-antigen ligase family protein n=1 Tax=Vibrio breoganii TaxID=553239 RepID=UPI000C851CEF|nr:O-antigen ligase family protein [Vibrio breoganii]PMG10465.1 hypothetical protein BCV00_18460 [Vibrio breoganii]